MRKFIFFKCKFYLPKKLGKMNLFFESFFSHKEAHIWFSLCACDRGITDRCPIVCLRLSRVQQSICFRSFKSLAAHFVRDEYRLVHHTASLYDSLVNGQCLSALSLSDRLRLARSNQSRTHSKSWIAWNFRAHPPVIISLKLIVWWFSRIVKGSPLKNIFQK